MPHLVNLVSGILAMLVQLKAELLIFIERRSAPLLLTQASVRILTGFSFQTPL